MTTGSETDSSQVMLLESKARVARGRLLQTLDALMSRRRKLADSVERVKRTFHLVPLVMTGFGTLLALGVGAAAVRHPTQRATGPREHRPRIPRTLIVVGAALFVGLLTGFAVARRAD